MISPPELVQSSNLNFENKKSLQPKKILKNPAMFLKKDNGKQNHIFNFINKNKKVATI